MAKFPLGTLSRHIGSDLPYKRTGPTINRGKGNNSASTPLVFMRAVEGKFGKLDWDLAASALNTKAEKFLAEKINSLVVDWHKLSRGLGSADPVKPLLWLNPPFTTITPWAKKCAAEVQLGARILLLIPASVGANYYWDWIAPYADVYSVGRMVFDDCYDKHGELITTAYPKDLILCHYDWSAGISQESRQQLKTGTRNPNYSGLVRWRWQQ